jgi:DNA-directed RNA polymerase II subunit RPB2
MNGEESRRLATQLIHTFFTSQSNPLVRHHIDSYDQFVKNDIKSILKANNPLLIYKNPKDTSGIVGAKYKYKTEIYFGGLNSDEIFVGVPTISLNEDVRVLFPNEARLRNLTYAVQITMNVFVRITRQPNQTDEERATKTVPQPIIVENTIENMVLCNLPLMLHSRYCMLSEKPLTILRQMGECPYDTGGYFIIDGSEKVLITRQEGAFNTLWITEQASDPKNQFYASISSLNPVTRDIKRVSFFWSREKSKGVYFFGKVVGSRYKPSVLEVSIPFVLKPIPIFVLFRALGLQTDKEIIHAIFPDSAHPETALLADLLIPSINAAAPFLDTFSAIQYIKTLTKGFSVYHVLDIVHNHLFPHVEDLPGARRAFLADCVRKMLRVIHGLEMPANRDDTRNQRLLTSGFLCQMLFQNLYKTYLKAVALTIDKEYNYNESTYSEENFQKIFSEGNRRKVFNIGFLTTGLMRGFKGKWKTGSNKEEAGLIQEMSRLSYIDFMSHVRRVVLNFDTSMKLAGPRRLNPSQYGYFCTSETPAGGSIGVTKNFSMFTTVSIGMNPGPVIQWLFNKARVLPCQHITPSLAAVMVPVYVNSGIIGYTARPKELSQVLRLMKRTGCLPSYSSSGFNISERRLFVYLDDGRPLRPLIICEPRGTVPVLGNFVGSWRDLIVGSYIKTKDVQPYSQVFIDPLEKGTLDEYIAELTPFQSRIEYIDPYEQNECLIANVPEYIINETTHMEIHPSSIMGIIAGSIPFPNHNQSPRNQLGSSQSKQGISMYTSNWKIRYDNTANILCYGQMPLTRTIYQDYVGGGLLPYGENIILAMGMYGGYNQEDGIIMNADALARGQFRSINYRCYEAFEEDDKLADTEKRIGHPKNIHGWLDLRVNLDYGKLDDSGIVRVGEYVDQNTVIVSMYMKSGGRMKDASLTPQVWTRGRVEEVIVLVNPTGLRLVKIRITQDRTPELGDKFCLTPDHSVLTKTGWIPLPEVTMDTTLAQFNEAENVLEFVKPKEVFAFDYTDELYEIVTVSGSICVTRDHRVYVGDSNDNRRLINANLLYVLVNSGFYMYDKNMIKHFITDIILHKTSNTQVYCVSVPSEIFLVRRNSSSFWTGNSNRHGQKGTLNILYRGHDMPRTAEGIVPDMIMNPTAIPSRMTIGQILEMIMGNLGANIGAIGNGTAFMNEGSPHTVIGNILEGIGLNKLSNQILYNGMTGEMMTADIYMGVVYGMRLKHMTEDKWNARGEGRREQRTHQPTGGRGNEGGLKIGEMERDAIIAHGVSSFLQESMMKRSDGTTFIVCNGCGTIPIYNESEGLYICPLCDGPIQFTGNSVATLEPIPPSSRSSATFSKIEMPFATKLFFQEMETFTNMGMRLLTTKNTNRLKGMDNVEGLVTATEDASLPLPEIVYPEINVPEKNVIVAPTANEVKETLEKLNKEIEDVRTQTMAVEVKTQAPVSTPAQAPVSTPAQAPVNPTVPTNAQPQATEVELQPASIVPELVTQEGNPILVVDTTEEAMARAGLREPKDVIPTMMPTEGPAPPTIRRQVVRKKVEAPEVPEESQVKSTPLQPINVVKLG